MSTVNGAKRKTIVARGWPSWEKCVQSGDPKELTRIGVRGGARVEVTPNLGNQENICDFSFTQPLTSAQGLEARKLHRGLRGQAYPGENVNGRIGTRLWRDWNLEGLAKKSSAQGAMKLLVGRIGLAVFLEN